MIDFKVLLSFRIPLIYGKRMDKKLKIVSPPLKRDTFQFQIPILL